MGVSGPENGMIDADLHGVPAIEVELVSEVLNGFDFEQQQTFGDLVAWKATILSGTNVVAEQKSFLW